MNNIRQLGAQVSPPPGSWFSMLRALAVFGLLLLAATSYYTIPADSVGVLLRFGRFAGQVSSGLHFRIPLGVDTVFTLPTQRQLKLEFGFGSPGNSNPDQVGEHPMLEKTMVTGDLNSVMTEWIIQYRIAEPQKYLFKVRDPGQTLRDLSEAVMREVVGDRTVDEVITVGRQDIEITALSRLKDLSAHFNLGVTVDQVQLKNVNPPGPVQASFNEVNRSQQDRENLINMANGEYNKAVPRARGEADQKIRAAEGYRFKRVNEAEGDVSAFNSVFAKYAQAPDVTRTRIYFETLGEVLPMAGAKFIVDDTVKQILPLLPYTQLTPEPQP